MSDPHVLRLWLAGPLQSWGTSSRFEVRTTDLVPSKSGVIGLLAAALGRARAESVDDLAAMRFGVLVVEPGRVLRDYQTVGAGGDGIAVASGARSQRRGIVTERSYLEDAAFVAAFESDDAGLLGQLSLAVQMPHWPLALGRRSCPPGAPVAFEGSVIPGRLEFGLAAGWSVPFRAEPLPQLHHAPAGGLSDALADDAVTLVVEDPNGHIEVYDQPVGAAFASRTFIARRVGHLSLRPVEVEA